MEAGNGNHKAIPINKFFKSHRTGIDNKELKMQLIRRIFSVSEINTNHENFRVSMRIMFSSKDYTSLNTHSLCVLTIKYQQNESNLYFWISNDILLQQPITKCTRNSKNTSDSPSSCWYNHRHQERNHLPIHEKTFKTIINLTSPHYKSSCILNPLPLISLVWLVISWNSYSCKIWKDNITESWNMWTFYSTILSFNKILYNHEVPVSIYF